MRTEGTGSKRTQANLPRIFYSLLRFPAVRVCSTMRISILIRQVREHGIQNARVYWGSSLEIVRKLQLSERYSVIYLHVEVNRSGLFGNSILPLW